MVPSLSLSRSLTARLGLSVFLAAVGGAALAAPAHAQPGQPYLDVHAPDHMSLLVRGAQAAKTIVAVDAELVPDAKLTVDLAKLAGVATVDAPDGCTTAGTTMTCPVTPDATTSRRLGFTFRTTSAAKAGTTADITFRAAAAGVPPVERHTTVEVVDDVDLAATSGGSGGHVKPGARVHTPIHFVNIGTKDAAGATIRIWTPKTLDSVHYDNCAYDTNPPGAPTSELATCTFTGPLAPGQEYQIVDEQGADGVAATVRANAYGDAVVSFDVQAAGAAKAASGAGGRRLRLAPHTALKAQDYNPANNGAEIAYFVDNTYDYALLGDTATGKVGDVVHVKPAIRSNGPSSPVPVVLDKEGHFWWPKLVFTLPEGTEAAAIPQDCVAIVVNGKPNGPYTWELGKAVPGGTVYRCWAPKIDVGQTLTEDFALRITKLVPNATGPVSFHEPYGYDSNIEDPYTEPQDPPADRDTGNDKATVVINPTTGGTGGGSGLPITGARSGLIAGTGVVLLAIGGALVLLARRRKATMPTP